MTPSFPWYELIVERLDKLRRSHDSVRLAAGVLMFLAVAVSAAMMAAILEMTLSLQPGYRTALVFATGSLSLLLLVILVAVPLIGRLGLVRSTTDEALARRIGDTYPNIRDRLVNLLELHADAGDGRYSQELIDVAGRRLAKEIGPLDFKVAVDRSLLRRSRVAFIAGVTSALLLFALFPSSLVAAFGRLAHYSEPFVPFDAVSFLFETPSDRVVKGSEFSTTVRVVPVFDSYRIEPRTPLTFLWRPENQSSPDRLTIQPDSSGLYHVSVADVRTRAVYRALFDGFESAERTVLVVDPPVLRSFRVRLDYPGYTGLPAKLQEEFVGDIAALPGTRVTITGTATNELASAHVRFSDGGQLEAHVQERAFTVKFPVSSATRYLLDLTDVQGLRLADPISYSIVLVDDMPPSIELVQPGRNLDISQGGVLPLLIRISDDYGFSSLRLLYRLSQSRYERPWDQPRTLDLPLPQGARTTADVSYPWSLDPLDLVPEDVVEYALEIRDNDVVRGPKSARTPLFLLRLPSLDEIFADAEQSHHRSLDEMQKTLEQTQELKETIDKIDQDMRQNKPLDWQQQKALDEVRKQYQDVQESVHKIQEDLAQMVSSLDQQNVLSSETLQKYLELQQLFQELNSEELQRTLQQLQQSMANVNRQQVQEAMQRLKFSEEQFRASIERTINLLKRIQIEQKLDEAIRRTDELRKNQAELHDRSAPDSATSFSQQALAQQQEDLRRSQSQVEASTREVQERMNEFFAEMPVQEMGEVNRQLEEERLSEQMSTAAQQLRSGQREASRRTQSQVLNGLNRLSNDLHQVQQQLLEQQSAQTINALRQASMDLLELSRRQEKLKDEAAQSQGASPGLRENAQGQTRNVESLTRVAQSLATLGQRSFAVTPQMARSIGEALQEMRRALQSLDQRNGQAASRHQRSAMGALNASAMAIQNALDAMMQGGSGGGPGGLMAQLRALAGQQQSLNAQTQSMEAAAQAARLATEQAAIEKSLQQLNREFEQAGQSDRLLGDLERLSQEMSEVVKSLEQQDVGPETIRRQERILSRLLDASHSLRERDFEKRRKATTGTPIARTSPAELNEDLNAQKDRLRQDLLRALEQGYSKEYEELIRKYFEDLQKLEGQQR